MGTGIRKRPGTKQLPYLSHEFIIKNHGDIATCLCMVFVVGLMFQTTSPLASAFISPSYNVTELTNQAIQPRYSYGYKDLCLVFFYTIAAVIFHAIIQEYVLDKILPKTRLSKTKEKKFNESGQLFAFYAVSVVWALSIFRDEGFLQSVSFLWTGYPHVGLTFMTKYFFIIQLGYWVHVLPELYFQKVKKEEMLGKIVFASINFIISAAIYILNLTRLGLVLLFIDCFINLIFHLSRLFYFSGKNRISKISFNIYNVSFVLARLTSIILSIFVLWFGLKNSNSSVERINWQEGNFNTSFVRLICLTGSLIIQAWMLWNFILFHCKKRRENTKQTPSSSKPQLKKRINKEDSEIDSDKDTNSGVTSETSKLKSN